MSGHVDDAAELIRIFDLIWIGWLFPGLMPGQAEAAAVRPARFGRQMRAPPR
jgi:hypothetical protein